MNRPATHQLPRCCAVLTRMLAIGVVAAGLLPDARAVVMYFNGSGQRSISLRVGSNDTAVNAVTFDVIGANVAPSPAPVQGTPGSGAPGSSPAGGIEIELTTNRRGASPNVVRLVADSSGGLSCVSVGCGSTIIPFNTISWISNNSTAQDIQSGSFNGTATQALVALSVPTGSDSVTIRNVLIFTYDNATLYPSGTYSGRVTFTATVP